MNAVAHPRTRQEIDPRFRRRRIEVQRENGRRRLRRVLVLLAIVGVVVLGIIVVRSPLFDLDHIEVGGVIRSDQNDVLAVAGLSRGEPLMDADIVSARTAIESLPWVFSAVVAREWPGTVTIDVVERQAVAALPSGAGYAIVDRFGHVVERVAQPTPGMPLVSVNADAALPGEVVEESVDAVRTAAAMPRDLVPWVASVLVDEELRVVLELTGGASVLVGSSEELSDKYVALATLLTRVDLRCVRRIDVRVPRTPVLTRRASCS